MTSQLIGSSTQIAQIRHLCRLFAGRRRPVFILGESGTGKSLVADALHNASGRRGAFVRVAASELDLPLLKSTLAGHAQGAFTGALRYQVGLLEAADGGTVFLDDVQDLRLDVQSTLLDAVEGRPMRGVGMTRTTRFDVRWLFGSQVSIHELTNTGRLKVDLGARMGLAEIRLPPLREHAEDLLDLIPYLMKRLACEEGMPVLDVSPPAIALLHRYPWPCNVRELDSVLWLTAVCAWAAGSASIRAEHLPDSVRLFERRRSDRQKLDRNSVVSALEASSWVVSHAAALLGVRERTVFRHMKGMDISRPERERLAG